MTDPGEFLRPDRIHRSPACGHRSRTREAAIPTRVLAEGPSSPPLRSQQPSAPFSSGGPNLREYGDSSHCHPPPRRARRNGVIECSSSDSDGRFRFFLANLNCEVKRRTLSGFTLDPNLSAHQTHELSRDRQTQPVPPYLRVVEESAWEKASKICAVCRRGFRFRYPGR